MKKVVKLTESDLVKIVKRVVSEQTTETIPFETHFGGELKTPITLDVFDQSGQKVKTVQVYKIFNNMGKYFAIYKGPKTGKDIHRYYVTCESFDLYDAIDKKTYKNDKFVNSLRKRYCGIFNR